MSDEHPFRKHDHSVCRDTALAEVEAVCADRRLRLTPMRRRVLEILLESHVALGAYDVLQRLQAEGHSAQPPVAYRALDFLVENGFAHRIARLSAFVACHHPRGCHAPAFLSCRACNIVAEAQTKPRQGSLARDAKALGFEIEEAVIEAQGLCPSCSTAPR